MAASRSLLKLCGLLAFIGCGERQPTGIVVSISTDIQVPSEIDGLRILVRSHGRLMHDRSHMLGIGEGKVSLPASLGLVANELTSGEVRIEVQGLFGPQIMVARSLREALVAEQVQRVDLQLGSDCLGVYCSEGKTCEPARGCVAVDRRLPNPGDSGPPCDCNSYFPLCRGGLWTYRQRDLSTNIPIKKVVAIQEYAVMTDAGHGHDHGKQDKKGFVQFRLREGGLSRRWLSSSGPAGAGRISYEKDEHFTADWRRTSTSYFVPQRARLDEAHTAVGDLWTVEYDEFVYRDGESKPATWKRTDEWSVVDAAELRGLPKQWSHALCQRRLGLETEEGAVVEQIYCFVRGIGKVYEYAPGDDEDVLTSYRIPGCGDAQ